MLRRICLLFCTIYSASLLAQEPDVLIRYSACRETNDSIVIEFEVSASPKCVTMYEEIILTPYLSGANQSLDLGTVSIKSRGVKNIEARDATLKYQSNATFCISNNEHLVYLYAVAKENWMDNATLTVRKRYNRNTQFYKQDHILLMERIFQNQAL